MNALLATSSSRRSLMREHVSSISITMDFDNHHQLPDLQALLGGKWPRLQRLNLESGYAPRRKPLTLGESLQLNAHLTRLELSRNSRHSEAISQLVLGRWPALKSLNLSHNKLGTAAIAEVAKADWPLEELQLGSNNIDVEAMKQLVQCKLSNLKRLKLDRNRLGTDSIAVLVEAQWPLQQLDLGHNFLGYKGIVYSDLPKTMAMACLARGRWPDLTMLVLAGNSLHGPEIAALSQANWPNLESRDLSTCRLASLDTAELCKARWPKLSYLNLANNRLDTVSMIFLSHADWPALNRLCLAGNKMGPEGMRMIRYHNWHKLEDLDLTDNEEQASRVWMQ